MLNSLPYEAQQYWEKFEGMEIFPKARRKEIFLEFLKGRDMARSEPANSVGRNISTKPDGQTTTSTDLVLPDRVLVTDTIRETASATDFIEAILKLGYLTGHEVAKDRAVAMAAEISKTGKWTKAELEIATALIITDNDLARRISYERTVAVGVFAAAKERDEVMAGRLHGYQTALDYAQDKNTPMTEMFEVVVLDDTNEKRWRMI